MFNVIYWKANPIAFSLFGIDIAWYGVFFAVAFGLGYFILNRMMKYEKGPEALVDSLLLYVAIAVVVGARLGHCLFYEPAYYLSHPLQILHIREGGLASHGAAIAIPIALWMMSRKYKISVWYLLDRVVIVVALSGLWIRMGNLINSEIYGDVTQLPWGFVFLRNGETLPKHPTQIYEALTYFVIFVCLILFYRKSKGKIPEGRCFAYFLISCFSMRFLIEFVKEPQVAFEMGMSLNMGQYLSIPFILLGVAVLILSYRSEHFLGLGKESRPWSEINFKNKKQ